MSAQPGRLRNPLALPARSLSLSLPKRPGTGADILLELESEAGYWAFEDDNVIALAAATFGLNQRSLVLHLPAE